MSTAAAAAPTLSAERLAAEQLWPLLDAARLQSAPSIWLVCASHRLAQHWLARDGERQRAQGRAAWLAAPIVALDRFLEDRYERASQWRAAHGAKPLRLLDGAAARVLWRGIVEEEALGVPLLRRAEAARQLAQAWKLVHDWQLALPFALPAAAEVEWFNRCAARFARRCAALHALDAACLPQTLADLLADGAAPMPQKLVLAGFEEIPPALRALFEQMRGRGCDVLELAPAACRAAAHRVRCADEEQELRAAANWARGKLVADPQSRLAIVVPDLAARRTRLLRIFDEVLCPDALAPGAHAVTRPYNVSLGLPLSEQPPIGCALELLAVQSESLSCERYGRLLLSRHWGGEAERFARAALEADLRAEGFLNADLATLAARAKGAAHARLQTLLRKRAPRGRRSPAQCAQQFQGWLDAAGWPGDATHTSDEHQALAAWQELLAHFGRLSALLPSLTFAQALLHLRELAAATLFQPQSRELPVQVLGWLEASGLSFDALWLTSCDDTRLPAPPRPQPLIPLALQRRLNLPHASSERELAFARSLLDRLLASADEAVVSHAATVGEEERNPSPLIAALPALEPPRAMPVPPRWQELFAARRQEEIDDRLGAPLIAQGRVRGGVRLFGDQAACPFRAYARHRLRAERLDEPDYGPTPRDRGILVHRALERVWRELRDQAGLLSAAPARLEELIGAAVAQALDVLQAQAPQRLSNALRELERQRLSALLAQWLALERGRPPFRVAVLEGQPIDQPQAAQRLHEIGGLAVQLRPDRIDELAGGARLILDYKTGQTGTPWREERPEEAQLLIYATAEPATAGIAYASLRTGELGLSGVASRGDLAPELEQESHWDETLARWRSLLEQLAAEYRTGEAAVLPKDPRKTCEFCGLQPLCRIRESAVESDDAA